MEKWLYMDGYDKIITDQPNYGNTVMDTKDLGEHSTDIHAVLTEVVRLHNEGNDIIDIDNYLLDEARCSQEDREEIIEGFHAYLYPKTLVDMKVLFSKEFEGVGDNDGKEYGIYTHEVNTADVNTDEMYNDADIVNVQWFKTEAERDANMKNFI